MFSINSILFVLLNVFLHFFVVSSKCIHIPTSDDSLKSQTNFVECRNVRSMQDLAMYMRSNWHQLKIVNDLDSVFTVEEHHNPFLQYIQHLDLSAVGALQISDYGFNDFPQLNHLNISNTQTLSLKDHWFVKHNNVQTLDVSWNELTILRRETFRTLSNLVSLNFSHNEIERMETFAFADLKKLKRLDLRNNRIDSLINYWGNLSSLEALHLDDNSFTKLPSDGFRSLPALQTLTVSQNSINFLEKNSLSGLHQLLILNLSGNSIETIPNHLFREFSDVRLQVLDLNNNDISTLPSNSFENLRYLVILDLSGNNIRMLNEYTFVGLSSLRKLYLNNNNILTIEPKTFARLDKLDHLDLSSNSLVTFSGDVFSTAPNKLRKLFLKMNDLVTIQPYSFDALVNLDFLVLAENSITELDQGLLLPLTKLKKFHINRNRIEDLSGLLFSTAELLEELYMDHNRLTFFPNVTNSFSRLTKMALEGNPWQCACFRELLDWAKQRGINYSPYISKRYYNGSRPICVVTQWSDCVRDIDAAQKKQIIEIYEAAFK